VASFFNKSGDKKTLELSKIRKDFLLFLRRLPDVVHLKQMVFFSFIFSIIILVLFVKRFSDLKEYTSSTKASYGGSYSEGVVGEIKKLNPLFSSTNPAEDESLELIFSGLTEVSENGQQKGDLASAWTVSSDGLTYEFTLKDNIKWHDGNDLTSDDVIFTVQAIKNPETRSPYFQSFKGVTAEKIDDKKLKLILQKPLNSFINGTSFGILPKHLLEKTSFQNLKVDEYNQSPVGSGPFVFVRMDIKKEYTEVHLKANKNYFEKKPYLEKIKIRTYKNEEALLDGYIKKEIQGISRLSLVSYDKASKLKDIRFYNRNFTEYMAVFFNLKNEFLNDKSLRQVLNSTVDRKELEKLNKGVIQNPSPVPAGISGRIKKEEVYLNPDQAKEALEKIGWKMEGDIRKKDGKELKLNLFYPGSKEYQNTAEYLKKNWEALGLKIELSPKSFVDLQQNNIRPRDYDMLLFSQNLGGTNDLYPFWHSSFKVDPGLNLSYFDNKKLDKYLEMARSSLNSAENLEMLGKVQELIYEERPAVFLYSSPYYFGISNNLKGINISKVKEPKDRFNNIENWFVTTK